MCSLEQTIPEDEDRWDFLPTTVPTLLKNEEDDYTPPTRSWDITPLNEERTWTRAERRMEVRATLAEVQQHKAGNAEGDDQQPTVSWELAAEVQETLERVKQRLIDLMEGLDRLELGRTISKLDPAIQDAMKFITASQELQKAP
eukprot:Skav202617  [mRNA]  locus=scaffold3002:236905:245725:+ [translate_table: standard]